MAKVKYLMAPEQVDKYIETKKEIVWRTNIIYGGYRHRASCAQSDI